MSEIRREWEYESDDIPPKKGAARKGERRRKISSSLILK